MLFVILLFLWSCVNQDSAKSPSTDQIDSLETARLNNAINDCVISKADFREDGDDQPTTTENQKPSDKNIDLESNTASKEYHVNAPSTGLNQNQEESSSDGREKEEEKVLDVDETVSNDNNISIEDQQVPPPNKAEVTADHSIFDGLLQSFVDANGRVDYKGIKTQKSVLEQYLSQLRQFPPTDQSSRQEQMAYWINAYNAFTIKLIVDAWPVKSIKDLEGGNVWDKKWIEIKGKAYSLNNIENDILRPRYKDARIHFAVNCAAASCPPLWNKAWTGDNLESALVRRTRQFINDPAYNTLEKGQVEVSKIFDWYGSDFADLVAFLNQYSKLEINENAKIQFKTYDWSLNDK